MKINCWSNQQNPTPLWKFMMKCILRHTKPKRTTLYHIKPWALLKKPCLDSLFQQSRYRTVSALLNQSYPRFPCYIEKQMHYEWQMYSRKKKNIAWYTFYIILRLNVCLERALQHQMDQIMYYTMNYEYVTCY